tara:strand:+ start:262 stop:534 length:273 start_codon:yes stop_codon:yes gene_type:complete
MDENNGPMEYLRPSPLIIPTAPQMNKKTKSTIIKKQRCSCCNKKLLILMDCICGKKFCLKHLDKEIHKCVESQETIKMGEKIEFKKVDKI